MGIALIRVDFGLSHILLVPCYICLLRVYGDIDDDLLSVTFARFPCEVGRSRDPLPLSFLPFLRRLNCRACHVCYGCCRSNESLRWHTT